MTARFVPPPIIIGSLLFLLLLVGCSNSITAISPPATATNPPTAIATMPPATSSPAPTSAPGVCNAADFPTQTPGGPPTTPVIGPPAGFQYPPMTYYFSLGGAAGTYANFVCSSGNPAAILAFMEHSIPAGGWTITATTSTTLTAVQTSVPQEGLCASVNMIVGSHPGYPGEWDANFHSPTSSCTP